MRNIVAGLFVSLDGVVESPEKWQMPYFNDEMGAEIGAQLAQADALLLGRRTYEEFADFWPQQGDAGPGAFMNNVPKLVVSRTLDTVEWHNSSLIKGDVVDQLSELKQQPGKNILVDGSSVLTRTLATNDLVDEYSLHVYPIVLGSGKRLFPEGKRLDLTLVEASPLPTGVVFMRYRRQSS